MRPRASQVAILLGDIRRHVLQMQRALHCTGRVRTASYRYAGRRIVAETQEWLLAVAEGNGLGIFGSMSSCRLDRNETLYNSQTPNRYARE